MNRGKTEAIQQREREILRAIEHYTDKRGYAPRPKELAAMLGLSESQVRYCIKGLNITTERVDSNRARKVYVSAALHDLYSAFE